jgi:hypothetical protein
LDKLSLTRQEKIHEKGFGMGDALEFGKMKVGKKTFQNPVLDLDVLKNTN